MLQPTADGQSTSTYFSEKAGPSTRSDIPICHHTQIGHSYHTFPQQSGHYQWQQATPPYAKEVSNQQILLRVPRSFGLQLSTPSMASGGSLHREGEHS